LSIAVDLANSSKVYAATTLGGSIRVTTNGGQSWSYIPLEHIFYALLASPIEPGVLYAGTNDGLWRYESNSSSWTQLGLAGKSVTAVTVDPAHTNRIYAGTTKGAYASTDGGLTWNFANNDMNGITIDAISIDSFNSDLVYYSSTTHGIFLLASDN
jgi:ligand-binding sensor domain-containing protein